MKIRKNTQCDQACEAVPCERDVDGEISWKLAELRREKDERRRRKVLKNITKRMNQPNVTASTLESLSVAYRNVRGY